MYTIGKRFPTLIAQARVLEYKKLTPLQLLVRTRAIIEGKWCQGSNASNAAGLPVSPMSQDAVCWCLRGAAIRALEPSISVLTTELHQIDSKLSQDIADVFGFKSARHMVQWNDTQSRTRADVLHRIDARIEHYQPTEGPSEDAMEPDDEGETEASTARVQGRDD